MTMSEEGHHNVQKAFVARPQRDDDEEEVEDPVDTKGKTKKPGSTWAEVAANRTSKRVPKKRQERGQEARTEDDYEMQDAWGTPPEGPPKEDRGSKQKTQPTKSSKNSRWGDDDTESDDSDDLE